MSYECGTCGCNEYSWVRSQGMAVGGDSMKKSCDNCLGGLPGWIQVKLGIVEVKYGQ